MDNSKQVETVKKALELEVYIANTSMELSNLLSDDFDSAPNPPIRNVIQRTYPKIVPTIKFDWKPALIPLIASIVFAMIPDTFTAILSALLIPLSLIWIPVYYFAFHRRKRKENIEQIRNSADYQNQYAVADKEFDKMQEDADALYQKQYEEYETVILPKYNKDLEDWTVSHNEKVNKTENDLRNAKNTLNKLYEETKIVPLQYREIYPLQFIYDTISTSDYDVKYAIEMYERNEQRKLDEEKLYAQQQANQLADEQNYLLQEQNEISSKARRDANIAAVVGTVQRHNTNKTLKNWSKK